MTSLYIFFVTISHDSVRYHHEERKLSTRYCETGRDGRSNPSPSEVHGLLCFARNLSFLLSETPRCMKICVIARHSTSPLTPLLKGEGRDLERGRSPLSL